MRSAIFPGTFDPVTKGHIDIIKRSSTMFDNVVVAVLCNRKKTPFFDIDERLDMINNAIRDLKNVTVLSFDGLLVDFAKKNNINVIIRGIRPIGDIEYEFQIARTNHMLYEDLETVFILSNEKYSYVSSSIVKEVVSFGGDASKFVDEYVLNKLSNKYRIKRGEI